MSIVSLAETIQFCNVDADYFTITAGNDVLVMEYNGGGDTNVDIPDATYSGTALATAATTAMNAALTMTGTVTWSDTTRKFTFATGDANLLSLTLTGSDAAFTFGITADKAAATSWTSDDAAGDPTAVLDDLRAAAETYIKENCRREFESTAYTRELQNGKGAKSLYLVNYPITAFYRLSIGTRGAITIKNTNTYTSATASITSTGAVLVLNGTPDSTVLFATYTTMTTFVAAINALGNGWVATVSDSTYANFASSELLEVFGQNCIDSNEVTFYIAADPVSDYEIRASSGIVTRHSGFTRGVNNISMDYTAGYSASTMPEDIKTAVLILTKNLYQRWREESYGANAYSVDGITVNYLDVPDFVKQVIGRYKRRLV